MPRLVIHAGTAKTGSSSIQSSLTQAMAQGALPSDILYPTNSGIPTRLGLASELFYEHNNILGLIRPFSELPEALRKYFGSEAKAHSSANRLLTEIRDAFSSQKYQNVVISAEYIGELNKTELEKLNELLNLDVDDLTIEAVVYFRPPSEMYLSVTSQTQKISTDFSHPNEFRFDYPSIVRSFSDVFGKSNCHFRNGSRPCLFRNDIVADFCERYLDIQIEAVQRNESLSVHCLAFLREFRSRVHAADVGAQRQLELLVPFFEEESNIFALKDRPKLKERIIRLINNNHVDFCRELKELQFDTTGFPLTRRPQKAEILTNATFESLFANFPSKSEMYDFSLNVSKRLLIACIVMNEIVQNKNSPA